MIEYCNVAWGNCKNPCAYGFHGGYANNSDPPRTRVTCYRCGSHACANCRVKHKGEWVCKGCFEDAE